MTRAEIAWSKHDWFVDGFVDRRYEAMTLRLGDIRYTPDFSGVCVKTGQLCLFEIKASGHRAAFTEAARIKLRAMASEFGELRFYVCWPIKAKGPWHIEGVGNRSCRVDAGYERVES
jgi:hypothetical protein